MRHTVTQFKRHQSGSALVLTLIVVVVLVLVGQGLLAMGFHATRNADREHHEILAQCAADTGIERAIFLMGEWSSDDDLPSETNHSISSVDATYSFTISEVGSSYQIVSTGQSGDKTRTIYATISKGSLFDCAILTKDIIELKNSVKIESVDSRISLSPGDTNENADIGTISTGEDMIILKNSIEVYGDLYVGTGGDPDTVIKKGNSIDTGDWLVMSETPDFPEVSPPSGLPYKGSITVKNTTRELWPSDSGRYDFINLKNSSKLSIESGDVVLYVTGDIDMGNSTEISIEGGATLTIYFDGDFVADNSNEVNTNEVNGYRKRSGDMRLYGTAPVSQDIQFKNSANFYGVVYAPNADLLIFNSGTICGSFVGKTCTADNSGEFYYDVSLKDEDFGEIGGGYSVSSWREE